MDNLGSMSLIALEIDGSVDTIVRQPFATESAPLLRSPSGLAQIEGETEAAQFDRLQRIERDIWLLNGGNGNRQGTLP